MSLDRAIESLRRSRDYRRSIVHVARIPARPPKYSDVAPPLSPRVRGVLASAGIDRLYTHQAEAVAHVREGHNVVAVTSTASGKSLSYVIPILEALEIDPKARALLLFPTKALAQDQLGKLKPLLTDSLSAATYDGDTPRSERPATKRVAQLVLTNPDMLHVGILPYHTTWSYFFSQLKYVVIDEVHMYRGVFGSHVANVIRRLKRVCEYYGSSPQFICASATVNDPGRLVSELIGEEVSVVDNDGSPTGEKVFAFLNPPFMTGTNERRSTNVEAVELFTKLLGFGVRTIVFTLARKTAELILRYSRSELQKRHPELADRIMAYRAGYTPAQRRDIERQLFSGELVGVTSTTALEVGVDIGGLDAAILTGYPGSVASTWQQAGRAGRGTESSLAVLIAMDNPLDQYLMRDPNYILSGGHERMIIDQRNPYVLAGHLLCAAQELPLTDAEVEKHFGAKAWEVLGNLAEMGLVEYRGRWLWTGTRYPAGEVNIRSASGVTYNIVSIDQGGVVMGTADESNVFTNLHQGAIYLHAGESYVVNKLSLADKTVFVERTDVDYYTVSSADTHIVVDAVREEKLVGPYTLRFGDVTVSSMVTHYMKKRLFTDQVLERKPLDLPETLLKTEAVWFAVPMDAKNRLIGRAFDLGGSIHALEHNAIGIMPLYALCDRNDIGGVSHPSHPDVEFLPAVFIYDGYPGGVGLARAAFEEFEQLATAALVSIESCPCEDGCPSCVQSPKCGNNNQPLDKAGAVFLLETMLRDGQQSAVDSPQSGVEQKVESRERKIPVIPRRDDEESAVGPQTEESQTFTLG